MLNWKCKAVFAGFLTVASALAHSTEDSNTKLVRDFYEMAFNDHQPTKAARLYLGSTYIQHNPHVPNGPEAFYTYFEGYFKKYPKARATIHRTVAQGPWVMLHVHFQQDPMDVGSAVVDLFRLENGKIVEHFDVIQPVVAKTANGNTMFSGSKSTP